MMPVFTHSALHVRDLEESVVFYREFCGLKIVDEHGEGSNNHAIWMTEDGREKEYVFVLLLGGLGYSQRDADLSHFGFAVGSKSEVDEGAHRGRAAGILAWAPKEFPFPVGYRCTLRDPDGYIVEFSYGQPLAPDGSASV
jgi:catechol 2,3-dioxygenase-like lactoylglutathione lyase family enzyme